MFLKKAFQRVRPSLGSVLLSLLSACFLVVAFPDFDYAPVAFGALIPLFFALFRERESFAKSFVSGWIFGTAFFYGSGWWLTFAPITYAGFPVLLAYTLLIGVCLVAGVFFAFAGGLISFCIKRYGNIGVFAAPFVWVTVESARLWITGNSWNSVGYSQAFGYFVSLSSVGGVSAVTYLVVLLNSAFAYALKMQFGESNIRESVQRRIVILGSALVLPVVVISVLSAGLFPVAPKAGLDALQDFQNASSAVVAVQPNVPMSGVQGAGWIKLRSRQAALAEAEVQKLRARPDFQKGLPITVILPESPMNFHYEEDVVFRNFIHDFATRNDVFVLFNSAEPDRRREYGYFNSAVLVSSKGEKAAQYDKIHLLPFGEFVPFPEFAQDLIPPMVGRFSFGEEYDILPVGGAKAGIMICFESHFASLSREFTKKGADVLIEMTNDGYLGPTPVLRQHLASAAFRAAETRRPVLRVTNVGVTAYIDQYGRVFDTADNYVEATRVWTVKKSDGYQTLYVRYGEWLGVLCFLTTLALIALGFYRKVGEKEVGVEENLNCEP